MSIVSRFLDGVESRVDGCPVARRTVPSENTEACAGCPYNVAFPRLPQIGCVTRTPYEVFEIARSQLRTHQPDLAAELDRSFPQRSRIEGDAARAWLAIGRAWFEAAGTDDEREVASIIARFARVSIDRGVAVQILG